MHETRARGGACWIWGRPRRTGIAAACIAAALGLARAAAGASDPGAALGLPAAADAALRSIDAEHIRAHVRYLSDDLLEGRGTGVRGGDLAAKYIATQFALDGLKPAGDQDGFLQKIAFAGVQTLPETTAELEPASGAPMPLKLGDDYVTNNQYQTDRIEVDAPIVFVGYGIEAPEYRWDDYEGVDLKGKVALVIVNEPASSDPNFFKGEALTYYGRWTYKFEEAARKGAVGALIIHRTDLASYGWAVVKSSSGGERVYLADDHGPKLKSASWIAIEVARKLFQASGLKLDDMLAAAATRDFRPRELPVRFRAQLVSKVRRFESYNVVGLLPGARPGDGQAVIYTAHYDHLGMDPALKGDKIYNGAVDNATGVGILLELARAFGAAGVRPPHPVIFASVTAEEQGLLGSNYLGRHPPIPAQHIALDLNFDAIPPIGTPQSVSVAGAERTSFYPTVEKTAKVFGLEIQPDAEPGAGHYYRSDHFSLARAGIPAFSINTGTKFAGHPLEWGKAQAEDYTAKRYHAPGDEYFPGMDFAGNALLGRFGFALGWQALQAPGTVEWKPGDEFEAARKAGAAGRSPAAALEHGISPKFK